MLATGTPTVVVLVTGRPYAIPRIAEAAPALVATWFPGEEGGHAVAAVLTGAAEPSGRTPLTFGRGAGQQLLFYNDKPLGHTGYARSTTRPVLELAGFGRVALAPGQAARVDFEVHADRLSFTGRDLRRVVEPGTVEVHVGASCQDVRLGGALAVVGELRHVLEGRILTTPVSVKFLEDRA